VAFLRLLKPILQVLLLICIYIVYFYAIKPDVRPE